MTKGDRIKLVVAGLCLAGAGFIFYATVLAHDRPPNLISSEAMAYFKCTKCGHDFEVKALESGALVHEDRPLPGSSLPASSGSEGEAPRAGRIRAAPRTLRYVKCPSCNELAALSTARCEKHQLFYYRFNPDGTRGACEKCTAEKSSE